MGGGGAFLSFSFFSFSFSFIFFLSSLSFFVFDVLKGFHFFITLQNVNENENKLPLIYILTFNSVLSVESCQFT